MKTKIVKVEILKTHEASEDGWIDADKHWLCDLKLTSTVNGTERSVKASFNNISKLYPASSADNFACLLVDNIVNSARHEYFVNCVREAFEEWSESITSVSVSYDPGFGLKD